MGSKYEIWLFIDGQGEMVLPVLPQEIKIDYGVGVKTVNINGLGEVPIKADRQAKRISFSSIFPLEKVSGSAAYTLHRPDVYVGFFEYWAARATPLRLNITGTKINMPCLIESFKAHEYGGDVGTRHYSVTFVEHRPIRAKKVDLSGLNSPLKTGVNSRADNRLVPQTYVVKKGDWLMKIAREQLGDSGRYMEIFNLNRDILKNPDSIFEGQALRLP